MKIKNGELYKLALLIYGSNDYLDSLNTEEAKNEAKQNAIRLQYNYNNPQMYAADLENKNRIRQIFFELIKEYSSQISKDILYNISVILFEDLVNSCIPDALIKLESAKSCIRKKTRLDIANDKVFERFRRNIERYKQDLIDQGLDQEVRNLSDTVASSEVHYYSAIQLVISEFFNKLEPPDKRLENYNTDIYAQTIGLPSVSKFGFDINTIISEFKRQYNETFNEDSSEVSRKVSEILKKINSDGIVLSDDIGAVNKDIQDLGEILNIDCLHEQVLEEVYSDSFGTFKCATSKLEFIIRQSFNSDPIFFTLNELNENEMLEYAHQINESLSTSSR